MNKQSVPITSREYEKFLYIKSQYKGTCMTCGKYWHKGKYLWHKEGTNVPTYSYCNNRGHIKKYCQNRIREETSKINKNEDNKDKCNYCKMKITKKGLLQEEVGGKIICKQRHRRRSLRWTIYSKNIKPRGWQKNFHRGFRCHVTYGKLGRKRGKPQGCQNKSHRRR